MRKSIVTPNAPKSAGPYSHAVLADGFIVVAGQGPINHKTGHIEAGDIKSETRRNIAEHSGHFGGVGSSLNDLVRVGVFSRISVILKVRNMFFASASRRNNQRLPQLEGSRPE